MARTPPSETGPEDTGRAGAGGSVPHSAGAEPAPIHAYAVALARRVCGSETPVLLDYGCGAGEIVELALSAGMDAYGVDLFYGGGNARRRAAEKGLLGTRVFELADGAIPFPDGRFDVVVANQVFEHIDDFTVPLREIARVLKPGAAFVTLFPTRDVWREGHVGIPFVHRLRKGSRLRYAYALTLRALGAGKHKRGRPPRQWTDRYLNWIDTWTFYKPVSEVRRAFEAHFTVAEHGADYLAYRLERHPRLAPLAPLFRSPALAPLLGYLCSRLSGRVFVLRKR